MRMVNSLSEFLKFLKIDVGKRRLLLFGKVTQILNLQQKF